MSCSWQNVQTQPVIGSAANHYVEVLAGVFNAALCKVICFSSPLQILTFVRSLSIKLNVLCNLLFVSLVVFHCFCSFVVFLRNPFWHIYNEKEPLNYPNIMELPDINSFSFRHLHRVQCSWSDNQRFHFQIGKHTWFVNISIYDISLVSIHDTICN